MKYLIVPTTDSARATHTASDSSLRVVSQVSDDAVLEGPGELADTLDGFAAIPAPVSPVTARPYSISKLKLVRTLRAAGMETLFDNFLTANPTFATDFGYAQSLMSDDPAVVAAIPLFASASGHTADQITTLLKSCRD